MKYTHIFCKFSFIILFTVLPSAHAIEWSNAPLACLPSRAENWINANNIPLCHCPPKNYCPESIKILSHDIEFVAEWGDEKFENSVLLQWKDIPAFANGSIEPKNIYKYTNVEIKQMVFGPLLKKYNIDVTKKTDFKTKVTILLNKEVQSKINLYNEKLSPYFSTECCGHNNICPDGLSPELIPEHYLKPTVKNYRTFTKRLNNKFSKNNNSPKKENSKPHKYVFTKILSCYASTILSTSREGCLHGGTKITMADGTFKTIEDLKLGDEVKGNHGASKIIALSKFTQKEDRMYSINGRKAFFTVEHPVLTPLGWKSIDSTLTSVKSNAKIIGTLQVGDIILMDGGKQLKVTSIKEELLKGGIDAYNLSVTGDGSFIANGFIMKSFKQMQMHY